ncbi:hypothetical protein Adt_21226 [Abeliophyllum distichum]|uniref:Uncharacterized protein n=1 Tax=Abeliophyllum distichum TaxID=126358 RepID=A0ABD1SYQ9_9LAMI
MYLEYEQFQADLKGSKANILQLTKKLDDTNVAQRITAEAPKAANKEKRLLKEESTSHLFEEASNKRREEDEMEAVKLLGKKKELEVKLENAEADFAVNFYRIEAYTNFSKIISSVGHQEIIAFLWSEHPDLEIASLEAKFHPMDIEGDEKD